MHCIQTKYVKYIVCPCSRMSHSFVHPVECNSFALFCCLFGMFIDNSRRLPLPRRGQPQGILFGSKKSRDANLISIHFKCDGFDMKSNSRTTRIRSTSCQFQISATHWLCVDCFLLLISLFLGQWFDGRLKRNRFTDRVHTCLLSDFNNNNNRRNYNVCVWIWTFIRMRREYCEGRA